MSNPLYIYILDWFGCVWFYGIWTIVGYLNPNPLYTYILDISVTFNKFPHFFVQAFRIDVDSLNFSMLLLYMQWDDWPIFMTSGSNEQLHKEFEYTLLKPDYHNWWISKMQSGRDDTLE